MYCPNCGQASPDDRRFCKFCGTNLGLVSEALSRGRVSNANLSDAMAQIIEQWFGEKPDPPPEKRQLNDIRSGVITTFVGIGLSAFLYFLMKAVASSSHIDPGAVPIVRSIWFVGLIPFFIGIALIINGIFFYKPLRRSGDEPTTQPHAFPGSETPPIASHAGVRIPPSVTEQTTHRLDAPESIDHPRERERRS